MSYTFAKLSQSILDSSIWDQPAETRLVWITLLAMADHHGRVHASIGGIARRAIVPRQAAEEAMECFLSPDPDSRTPDNDGRRVERIEGGFRILNYLKYREMRDPQSRKEQTREAMRRLREKKKDVSQCEPDVSRGEPSVSHGEPPLAHREVDVEAEVDKKESTSPSIEVERQPTRDSDSLDGFAEIPTADEVVEFGRCRGIPEAYCRSYHERTEERRLWLNKAGYLVNWQRILQRFWSTDRAEWKPPKVKTERTAEDREAEKYLLARLESQFGRQGV